MIIDYLYLQIITGEDISKEYLVESDILSGRISDFQRKEPKFLLDEEEISKIRMNDDGYSLVRLSLPYQLKEQVKIYGGWGFKKTARRFYEVFVLFDKEKQNPIIEIGNNIFHLDGTPAKVPNFSEPCFPQDIHRSACIIPEWARSKPISNSKLKQGYWKELPKDIIDFFGSIKEPMTNNNKNQLCYALRNCFQNKYEGYDHLMKALNHIENKKETNYISFNVELSKISKRSEWGNFSEEVSVACELSDSISDVIERLVIGASLFFEKDLEDYYDVKFEYNYIIPKINDIYVFISKYKEALKYMDMYGLGNKKIPSSIFKKLEIKREQLLPNHMERIRSYKDHVRQEEEMRRLTDYSGIWIT